MVMLAMSFNKSDFDFVRSFEYTDTTFSKAYLLLP